MNTTTRLIRLPEVKNITGLSRASIYVAMNKGTFPKPIKLSERASAWVSDEINAWVHERIAEGRAKA